MNFIWTLITIFSCFVLIIFLPSDLLPAFLSGAQNGVDICFSLLPIYLVWSGIIALIEESGLSKKISKILSPIINKLFEGESEQTKEYVTLNFTANLLGAGGASTPLGIKAIRAMQGDKEKITSHSVLFTVINTTSIQLLPTTIISLLAQNGASAPYSVVLPTLIISSLSTVLAVLIWSIFCKKDLKNE